MIEFSYSAILKKTQRKQVNEMSVLNIFNETKQSGYVVAEIKDSVYGTFKCTVSRFDLDQTACDKHKHIKVSFPGERHMQNIAISNGDFAKLKEALI